MSTLSSSDSFAHKDMRSAANSYKRDKDSAQKWALGARPSSGVKVSLWGDITSGSAGQQAKSRPAHPSRDSRGPHVNINLKARSFRPASLHYMANAANSRYVRKASADLEARDAENGLLSRSLLAEFAAATGSDGPLSPTSLQDDGSITYSFDAPTGPRGGNGVGLTALVDRAEADWRSKETDKIVRDEYEMLDEEGESVRRRGKAGAGGKKRTATAGKGNSDEAVVLVEDGDYELV